MQEINSNCILINNKRTFQKESPFLQQKICFTVFTNTMIKPVSKSKPLFCEQYWRNIAKNTKPNKEHKSRVSGGFDIHSVNKYFIKNNLNKDVLENCINMPLYKFIAMTDKEFKQLTPTKESLVLWRGISAPAKSAKRNPRYEQSYKCKAGDTICMPEYAYASDSENVALSHALDDEYQNGIVYKINVPKGSKINNGAHYIFPRCSRFECLSTQDMTENEVKYKLITLNYLPPEETKLNFFEKIMRYFKK